VLTQVRLLDRSSRAETRTTELISDQVGINCAKAVIGFPKGDLILTSVIKRKEKTKPKECLETHSLIYEPSTEI